MESVYYTLLYKSFKVNKEEMDKPLHHYQNLHELFIRRLKPSARPVDQQKDSVVSPVDAKIEAYGVITPQKEMIVKQTLFYTGNGFK